VRREREGVSTRHDQLPVGKVDEPKHPEDQTDPNRHQRVDRPETDGVGQRLGIEGCENHRAHPAK
jgi:hypothetical protein